MRYSNLAAAFLHGISFIAALTVTLTASNRVRSLVSSDFVRGTSSSSSSGDDVLAIDLRVDTYQPVWLVIPFPLITSLFHFFISVGIPYFRRGYRTLSSKENTRSGHLVYSLYRRSIGKVISFNTVPLSWFDYYLNVLSIGINPIRWIEYSITSSLMIVVISSLSGISNIFLLVFQAIPLNVALMWIGGNYFEQDNIGYALPLFGKKRKQQRPVRWRFFIYGTLFFVAQWVAIFVYFFVAITTTDDVPVYVYLIVFGLFFNFSLFALNPFLHYLRAFGWISDFTNYELVFILLSFVSKFFLDWTLIIGSAVNTGDVEVSAAS